MKKLLLAACIVWGLTHLSAQTETQLFKFKPIPEWVKYIEVPKESKVSKYDILSGYYASLIDYQIDLEKDIYFNRQVINIVSYSGITNASQIAVAFDTSYQELDIHHVYIWRNGKKIDLTKELSFEIMNNENNLQMGIYNGLITAYDILNDIRKDDLIDFAYSITGNNPIFNNEKYQFIPLESENPLDRFSLRIFFPENKSYSYNCIDCDSIDYNISTIDGKKEITINNFNVKAIDFEDYMPPWVVPYKHFIISSMESWSDVNTWAQSVFALEKEQDLDVVFEEIFKGNETIDEKINLIINYVQDDIRYMGIESGIGSIKPFTPEHVIKQRFGDCKDKSLLLVTLLKKIGIQEAYPVLVNTGMQHKTATLSPSNQVFNHCIATFIHNDTTYWVDPSMAQQGGDFRNIYNMDYGEALIIGLTSDSLHKMEIKYDDKPAVVTEEFFSNSFTENATLKITSLSYNGNADQRRTMLDYYSAKDFNDRVMREMKVLFPEMRSTKKTEISDNIDSNIIVTKYEFEIEEFWQDGDKSNQMNDKGYWILNFEPIMLYQYFGTSNCMDRKYDHSIFYPINLDYRVIFNLPADFLMIDDVDKVENNAYSFETRYEQLSSKKIMINYIFKTKVNHIKVEDFRDICISSNSIITKFPLVLYFNK